MFEDVDTQVPGSPPPEESDNRTFIIAAAILGGITLLALICMAIYALFVVPLNRSRAEARLTEVAAVAQEGTAMALAAGTQTAEASIPPSTSTPTVTTTPTASTTPVIVQATDTPEVDETATPGPRTATVAALLTQAAQQTQTVEPTLTELPDTGFADDVGVPTLLAMAVVFIAVIFLVRRMRAVTG